MIWAMLVATGCLMALAMFGMFIAKEWVKFQREVNQLNQKERESIAKVVEQMNALTVQVQQLTMQSAFGRTKTILSGVGQ